MRVRCRGRGRGRPTSVLDEGYGCVAHFLGRSAHWYHDSTWFRSARRTHRVCARGVGNQEVGGMPWGSGVAPQPPIPLYPIGQQRRFWTPGMGVFDLHNAKKYCLGSGAAPQTHTPIPLYPIGQQRRFWIPGIGVFELHNAKQTFPGFWGGAPNTHMLVPHRPVKVLFGYLRWGCLNYITQKHIVSVLGWRSKEPVPLYLIDQYRCFCMPRIGGFRLQNAKKYCLGSGVAPQTLIPLYPMGQQRCCH